MDIKILSSDKESLELEINSLTMVEVLRVYLNKDSNVSFAAWRQEHPTKSPIISIKGKNPKKSVLEAINNISKDLGKIESDFSKLK